MNIKKNLYAGALIVAAITACTDNGTTGQSGNATDSLSFTRSTAAAEVKINVDYPATEDATGKIISEYISELLGGCYEGNLSDGDSLIAYYGNKIYTELSNFAKENGTEFQYTETADIKKSFETDKYITYTYHFANFTGGAHGYYGQSGATFRKSDGRKFGYDLLTNTSSEEFRSLIREGLEEYLKEEMEESELALEEMLLTDSSVDYLPLPSANPYISDKGLVLIYQPYEIAPYAMGMPVITIPFEKLMPFLTVTARQLIQQ